jgi:hypothetical protein
MSQSIFKLPYGEELPYWQTGKSDPQKWIDLAQSELRRAGGKILGHAYGSDTQSSRAAYMIHFELSGEAYKIIWPVLPSRSRNERAARLQAATMLYHDTKARCVAARVLGPRAAFFSYLLLPDGRTASQAATPELAAALPALFRPMLPGDSP